MVTARVASESTVARWRDLWSDGLAPRMALLCLGVWLNAADTLVTVTILPSVAADSGGYRWLGWATAAYLLGAIVAGAASGRSANRMGLRQAMLVGAAVYGLGCVAGAALPGMPAFVLARLVQGVGAGWIGALCYVSVEALFPARLWPRVFAAIAGMWGAATLLGPLVGGAFAEWGFWRGAFWAFAFQAALFAAATIALIPARAASPEEGPAVPWRQLATLATSVALVGLSGVTSDPWIAGSLAVAGAALLVATLSMDRSASVTLLPRNAATIRTSVGLGLGMVLACEAATSAVNVYGALCLQLRHHVSPLIAGYTMSTVAMGWTVFAFIAARAPPSAHGGLIRAGGLLILLGTALTPWAVPYGPLAAAATALFIQGAGFGLSWAFISERVVSSLADDERALGAGAIPTAQLLAGAIGAASGGLLANVLGGASAPRLFVDGAAGLVLFATFIPVAFLGAAAAWRLGSRRRAAIGAG